MTTLNLDDYTEIGPGRPTVPQLWSRQPAYSHISVFPHTHSPSWAAPEDNNNPLCQQQHTGSLRVGCHRLRGKQNARKSIQIPQSIPLLGKKKKQNYVLCYLLKFCGDHNYTLLVSGYTNIVYAKLLCCIKFQGATLIIKEVRSLSRYIGFMSYKLPIASSDLWNLKTNSKCRHHLRQLAASRHDTLKPSLAQWVANTSSDLHVVAFMSSGMEQPSKAQLSKNVWATVGLAAMQLANTPLSSKMSPQCSFVDSKASMSSSQGSGLGDTIFGHLLE